MVTGDSTRLTMPLAVPSATPEPAPSTAARASTVSPGSSVTNSVTGWPPDSEGAASFGGSAGISSTLSRIIRPADVTAPTVPRAVAETAGALPLTATGIGATLACGVYTALIGYLQYLGVRRLPA